MRLAAAFTLVAGLAAAGAGCDADHDRLDDRVRESALAESGEALEEGPEALVEAIREALDASGGGAGTFAVTGDADVEGEITLDASDPASVEGTIVISREEEGEAPLEVTIAGGSVPRAGGTVTAGIVTISTEAHVALGGGRGAHAHGGGEEEAAEEEEETMPITIDIPLPAPAGSAAALRFLGYLVPIELAEDFPEVPGP